MSVIVGCSLSSQGATGGGGGSGWGGGPTGCRGKLGKSGIIGGSILGTKPITVQKQLSQRINYHFKTYFQKYLFE